MSKLTKHRFTSASFLLAGIFLVGCSAGPDYERPKTDLPEVSLKADTEIEKFLSEKKWWEIFHDKTLNELEETALKNNCDIKQAVANIFEAAAVAGVTASEFFPSLSLSGVGQKIKLSQNAPTSFGQSKMIDYVSSANITYEIDLFGKYRRAHESAKAQLLASRAAKETVLLTVTSEVAKTYFMLRALDAKLAIARRTLKTREESSRVYKNRFENGYCTELDYLRITSELESVKTTVLDLEATREKTETAISLFQTKEPRERSCC